MKADPQIPFLPFPLSDVSNGEWCPRSPSEQQRAAMQLLGEEADKRAHRLGVSRRDFLRTAAGTATAYMVLNQIYGVAHAGDTAILPVTPEQCDDPDAAQELFAKDYFVMDVQLHHVDLDVFGDSNGLCFLRFLELGLPCEVRMQNLGQLNMIKEVFVDSETAVGVLSGVPNGVPMPVDTMAATRDLVNELAGSRRAMSQAMCDPTNPPGHQTSLANLERQVKELGAVGLKTYTGNGNWFLDDEDVAYPMLAEATRLGLHMVNVHKGFPSIVGPMGADFVRSRDFPKVTKDWPRLNFVAYHSGYFPGEGIGEFLEVMRSMRGRDNMYAEIGSAFAVAFTSGPAAAAHFIGSLLAELGSERLLWGTDSIWWGSPQWQIEAFKTLTIPPSMQEEFGYPPLTERDKARILGLNAARLYRVNVNETRCAIAQDKITRIRADLGGMEESRSHFTYGPRTRRDFLTLLAKNDAIG